jgi:hypothetical protein
MTSIFIEYLLRRQVPVEGNILETLQLRKSIFPIACPDAQMPGFERLAQKVKVI